MATQHKKIVKEEISTFKKGLDLQREQFKAAKLLPYGQYDVMCDAIENIKSEIKPLLIKKGLKKKIIKIEEIINWYRELEQKYTRPHPEGGYHLVTPRNLTQRIHKNLTIAYEILIQQLDNLGLL